MFRRLFALWSLVSLLLASGPVFAGGVGLFVSLTEDRVSSAVQMVASVDLLGDEQSAAPDAAAFHAAEQVAEVDLALDPMDWPEGIELLGILSRASQLSHAIVPHIGRVLPSPCLASLQRPPSARA